MRMHFNILLLELLLQHKLQLFGISQGNPTVHPFTINKLTGIKISGKWQHKATDNKNQRHPQVGVTGLHKVKYYSLNQFELDTVRSYLKTLVLTGNKSVVGLFFAISFQVYLHLKKRIFCLEQFCLGSKKFTENSRNYLFARNVETLGSNNLQSTLKQNIPIIFQNFLKGSAFFLLLRELLVQI